MLLSIVYLFVALAIFLPERVEAGVFDNAYTFYQSYENEMGFQPGANNEGEIFYATKGKKAVSSGTQYTTIGWKVTMKNSNGENIATLYYELGGDYMTTVDTQLVDGYEYTLYKVTLSNMRSRISRDANEALKTANCSIIFDACLALKINGVLQGGMTDGGPSWGNVYTTYKGIVGAVSWPDTTKETLKTYFNKTVEDIYYSVTLSKGTGVTEVTGAGKYCFGTLVTVKATVDSKYVFQSWTGNGNSTSSSYTFTILKNMSLKANAQKRNLQVNFYKESSGGTYPDAYRIYYNNTSGQAFPDFGWEKTGLHQTGWSLYKNATSAMYKITNGIAQSWIDAYLPEVDLYAVWAENRYNLVYDGNEGTGQIEPVSAVYSQEILLAEEGFKREGYSICGWSTKKGATEAEFQKGEKVFISDLAKAQNLEYTNEGTIVLYAVWDNAPIIMVEDIYVSLEDAKNGVITENWFQNYVSAKDAEDGELPFSMVDYSSIDFTSFEKDGAVSQTFSAVDSAGNKTIKRIWVYIVDTTIYDARLIFGTPRFLSGKYFKDESGNFMLPEHGGLWNNSIWRLDESYTQCLDMIFQ